MKKRSFLLICLMLSVSTLALAATEIDVWLTGHSNEEMRIIKEITETSFTAKTGIKVNYTLLSWTDNENRFLMAAATGDAPDVGGSGPLFLPELGLRGALMDLTNMPGFDEIYKRSYPNFYRSLQYKGLTFGVPYDATVTTAYFRTDIFNDLGIQKIDTWDELKQALPKLQARGSNFCLQFQLNEILYADVNMFMWQRGADDYTPDLTASGYDSPECIAAFTEYTELYTKYKIPTEIPAFQAFINGDLAMTVQYPFFYQNLTHAAPQIAGKWSIAEVPGTITAGKLNRTTNANGNAIGIFESSKKKDEAWEYIKWITDASTQIEISNRIMNTIQASLFMPSNRSAIGQISLKKEVVELFSTALENGNRSIYGLVAPRHRRRYLQMAAQKVILQGEDPKKAILEAAAEHNSEIKKKQVEYDRFIKKLLKR
ncbi:MAG TPA: extracellular solute-binding protein [Firmicutes bacterium]|nr:extracellular solute-binding protein [Bacillota bacterium]